MTIGRSRSAAAFAVVALATLAISHALVYLLAHGSGAAFADAMAEDGHDQYWTMFVATVVLALVGLALVAARQLLRLTRVARAARASHLRVLDEGRGTS